MNRKSRYKIVIDFKKSCGSYLYDKSRKLKFLDFFGQYASLAVGYNHEIFNSRDFKNEMKYVSKQKIVNNEILSDETRKFDELFQNFSNNDYYSFFHYSCTGALAVEAAIKTAIDYKKLKNPSVVSFKGSFHGINGYGGIISDRFGSVAKRLDGFPGSYWKQFDNPIISYSKNKPQVDYDHLKITINKIKNLLISNKNVCAIIVEPIQCTNGDRYFPDIFFKQIKKLSETFDIPLIFDEVQTGFCVTGKKWYFEHVETKPDIVIFGKKTQTSGIMVNNKLSKIFHRPIRLEVTWDGDVVDMVRCKYIIKAYKKDNVLKNVNEMSKIFLNGLKNINDIYNIRNCGLLFAFDLKTNKNQKIFSQNLFKKQMLCNPTGNKTIRFRPNLFVSKNEINEALNKINETANKLN